MFNIINKRVNIYKMIDEIKANLKDKMSIPKIYMIFRDVKGTENGKVYADTFYMNISNKKILDEINNKNIKYQSDPNKQVYNYIFNSEDKGKIKNIINNYNLTQYDRIIPIQEVEIIDNSYLEKYLYQYNKN